jgi:hypothetical protein
VILKIQELQENTYSPYDKILIVTTQLNPETA